MALIVNRTKRAGRKTFAECLCSCGRITTARLDHVKSGRIRSCGCARVGANSTHRMSKTPEFSTWSHMADRCLNGASRDYPAYGGRGITVCERWRGQRGFVNFLADMGRRPSPKHSIDRYPNNDGNYEPGNCRWANPSEQARNKRTTRILLAFGVALSLPEWSERMGIPSDRIRARIDKLFWSTERALTS
jgi:hypothetical protein